MIYKRFIKDKSNKFNNRSLFSAFLLKKREVRFTINHYMLVLNLGVSIIGFSQQMI